MTKTFKQWVVFSLLVLAVVVILRLPILQRSVIDWDESVYLLVASSVTRGSLPYVEVWSHKQPFLFVLLTLSFLCPDPIVGMRLLGCLSISVTAVLLAFMVRRVVGSWVFSGLAALLYVLATMAPGGLPTNTEILFAPFVTAGFVALMLTGRGEKTSGYSAWARFAFGGLLSGLAIQVKLVAAFEILVLAVSSLAVWWPRDKGIPGATRETARRGLCFGLGLLVPFVVAISVFWWEGALGEYFFANFRFNFAYTGLEVDKEALFRAALTRQAAQANLVLIILALVGGCWTIWKTWRKHRASSYTIMVGVAWMLASLASVYAAAKFYDHHVLQVLPSSVFLATAAIATLFNSQKVFERGLAGALVAILIGMLGLHARNNVDFAVGSPDIPREVGQYLFDRIEPGGLIYVANSQPIIYLLAGATSPTRFVQPAWVIRPEFRRRMGLDIDVFLDGVFDQRPSFVVMDQDNPWLPDGPFVELLIDHYLRGRYRPVARFGSVIVFQTIAEAS